MEIINYSENTAIYSYTPLYNKGRNNSYGTREKTSYQIDESGAKILLEDFKGTVLLSLRLLKSMLRYVWVIPAAALIGFTPWGVRKFMNYSESQAKTVSFAQIQDEQLDMLDSAMFDFAVDGSSLYDAEGNILGSEDMADERVFSEPVSFGTYIVRSGDTISGISLKFGLSNISTLIAVNGIDNVRSLWVGQKLKVPSMDGLLYTVKENDTLAAIAEKYNVSLKEILDVNDLSSEVLAESSTLFIPGAKLDAESLQRAMGEIFIWPLSVKFRISSRFGRRADPFTGEASNHTGIDMACAKGTPIKAAMSGSVIYTGYSSIYGNYVILKHYDGYQTLYAHMSKIIASKGDKVSQGNIIGLVGSTGYSTGPHLHFSVYKNGKLVDPMTVLK